MIEIGSRSWKGNPREQAWLYRILMFHQDERQSPKKLFKDNEDYVVVSGGVKPWPLFHWMESEQFSKEEWKKWLENDGDNQMLQKHQTCINIYLENS